MTRTPITDAVDKALEDLAGALLDLVVRGDDTLGDCAISHMIDRIETAMPHQLLYDLCTTLVATPPTSPFPPV